MPVKLGGGGSSGALTKSSFTAANAISAGDPVLIDGSGKVLKQTASGPTSWGSTGTGSRFLHYNNTGNAYGASWSRIDAASGRVAYMRSKHVNSNNRQNNLSAGTCTVNTAATITFATTNMSAVNGQSYGVNGEALDVIWDDANDGWIELGFKDASVANRIIITKYYTANGIGQAAYIDDSLADTAHNKVTQRMGSLVKDDNGKVFAVATSNSGSDGAYYGWTCRLINYSSNSADGCTFGTALLADVTTTGNYRHHDLCATFDSLNDQIVVVAGHGSGGTSVWAIDVAANGTITNSHSASLTALTAADGSTYTNIVGNNNWWKSVKCDSNGCLAAISHQGNLISFRNTGSAFTMGTWIRDEDTAQPKGIGTDYSSGLRVQGINVLTGAADTFCVPYITTASGTQTLKYYMFKVNSGDGTISTTINKTPTAGHSIVVSGSYSSLRGYNRYVPNNNHDVGGTQQQTLSQDGSSYFEYTSFSRVFVTNLDFFEYLGLAEAAISANASGDITLVGGVNENQSSKVAGKEYYLNEDGTVSAGSGTLPIGTAISPTKILVGKKLTPGTDLQPVNKIIKSVQRGYITSTQTTFTVAITEVDITKSFLNFSTNRAYSGTFYAGVHPRGTLTDGTTITFNGGGAGQSVYISWEVIEYV
tara:strand:- start:1059 stop:3005 length:1947 start_codon:yes stop_codon:yes gene_type:complete